MPHADSVLRGRNREDLKGALDWSFLDEDAEWIRNEQAPAKSTMTTFTTSRSDLFETAMAQYTMGRNFTEGENMPVIEEVKTD